jgi:hypothetical protein
MRAVARIYWTFFTAFKVQRWLGALGLVVLGLGVVVGFFGLLTDGPEVAAFPLALAACGVCVLMFAAFTVGGTLRALSAPQGHILLPHFRVRVLVAVALFVGSVAVVWYAAGAGIVLLAVEGGAPEGGLAIIGASTIYAVGALTALVLSVFVITGNPNWSWLGLPLMFAGMNWLEAGGPARLAAAGVSLPLIIGLASLSAWTAFAIWYLRVRRIRPVLLITDTHGWTEVWRRQANRQQKRWPAHLTPGSAIGIVLWSGRVQPALPRQLLHAAALGAGLCLAAPLLKYLPGQTSTTPSFTMFVWPFYAMLFTLFAAGFIVRQSRRAWLRVPGPRTRVLRAVEWEMARLYLRALTCITALVLVSVLVFKRPPTEAAWGVALMASAALYSMCMALASVRTAWPMLFGLFGMFIVQIIVLGVERDQVATSRVAALLGIEIEAQQVGALLGIQLAAAAVFFAIAERRWRNIDWLRLRPMRLGRNAIRP